MSDDEILYECPHCGQEFTYEENHDCPEQPAGARDGRCQMCGEEYNDYLQHLKHECAQRGDREQIEEPEPAEAATADAGPASWQKHPMFRD
jgi:DNA-directed RNA polymerase subunit RPC12/RpoP